MFTLIPMVLALASLVLVAQIPPDGTYRVDSLSPGAKTPTKHPSNLPPGAVRRFVIQKGRWMLFDMMVGFSGPIKTKGRMVTLIATDGPSGKMKKPDLIVFDSSADGKVLIQRPRKSGELRLVLTWISAKPIASPIK